MEPHVTVGMVKRAADLAAGFFGTLAFALAYPFLALLIKLESPGPALYRQGRVGRDRREAGGGDRRSRNALPPGTERRWNDDRRRKNVGGEIFTIYKFRTMRMDAEKAGPQLCGKDGDPRVTRIGGILRRLHLDELPQFWNVLKGDMSFIGPRPERPHFTVQYAERIPAFIERTRGMKPGILGLAQIVNGYDDGLESVVRKTHFDLAYRAVMGSFASWIRLEAWILAHTVVYYATGRPLAATGRFPALRFPPGTGPARPTQAAAAPVSAPLALAAMAPESERAAPPTGAHAGASVLDSLGSPSGAAEGAPGLAVALVRHRDTVRPTLIFVRGRGEAAPGSGRAPAPSDSGGSPAAAGGSGGRVSNFLTVDVECWFHAHNLGIPKSEWDRLPTRVVENTRRILDLLEARKAKATFFTLGYVADRYPEVVRMIDQAGHEIGTHGYMHDKITDMTPYEFEKDLDRSLNALARGTSRRIVGHRASNFSMVEGTLWAMDILARYGLEYDSSIFPVRRARYGIPDYPNRMPHTVRLSEGAALHEFPMSTMKLGPKALPISGGGYLRLYPYAVTDLFIRRSNRRGLPAMVYLHPWELDAEQERVKAGFLKSFQHYVNLDTMAWKLDRLLERHAFTSIEESLRSEPVRSLLNRDPVQVVASRGTGAPTPSLVERGRDFHPEASGRLAVC